MDEEYSAAVYTKRLAWLVKYSTILWAIGTAIDVGMMIVSIMAYTGAQSEDDREIIKNTWITFPPAGHHVQRTEIALASLSLVMNILLAVIVNIYMGRLESRFTKREARTARNAMLKYPVPWCVISMGAWAVCIVFQTHYVPVLGTNRLPECVEYGDELSQCGMVTASWIVAMVYCLMYLAICIMMFELVRRLTFLEEVESMPLMGKPAARTEDHARQGASHLRPSGALEEPLKSYSDSEGSKLWHS